MHYEWTETQQITIKGEPKRTRQFRCRYGPDGQVQKTPIGVQEAQAPQQRQGGKLRLRIIEKKKEEMQDYMGDVKSILTLYVPPNPQKRQRALQAGNVSFAPGDGSVNLVFTGYAQRRSDDRKLEPTGEEDQQHQRQDLNPIAGPGGDAGRAIRKLAGWNQLSGAEGAQRKTKGSGCDDNQLGLPTAHTLSIMVASEYSGLRSS